MKKLILSLVFTATFMFANAGSTIFYNCHTYACQVVSQYESSYGGTLGELEIIYGLAYESCNQQ